MWVVGGGTGLGREVAWGLTDAGMAVAVVGPSGEEPTVATALEAEGRRAVGVRAAVDTASGAAEAFSAAADALGPPDLIVHALTDPKTLVAAPIADTEPTEWDERCEGVVRAALVTAQAAWTVLRARGGRIVFVIPTVALTGAANLVPYVSAVEGIRALAKSAARQWGSDGITVNCVAPPLELVGDAASPPGLEATALGREPDARADVAPVLALLAAPGAHFVTGTTIVVDGGRVMVP